MYCNKMFYQAIYVEFKKQQQQQQHNICFPTFNLPTSLTQCYDWPVKYYFWRRFLYYDKYRLYERVQLSIYSTRLFFHKYFVTTKDRWMFVLYFERKSTFN